MVAPSLCACLTEEFIKTVHLDPKSAGCFAKSPNLEKLSTSYPIALAKVSIKDPHPEEQASFNIILFIALFSISKHLISCPPISKIKSTPGLNLLAAI